MFTKHHKNAFKKIYSSPASEKQHYFIKSFYVTLQTLIAKEMRGKRMLSFYILALSTLYILECQGDFLISTFFDNALSVATQILFCWLMLGLNTGLLQRQL
jgi:hypothetical protein